MRKLTQLLTWRKEGFVVMALEVDQSRWVARPEGLTCPDGCEIVVRKEVQEIIPTIGVFLRERIAFENGPKTEREQALKIALGVLDDADAGIEDPDSGSCILSRSYLRALEKIARLTAIVEASESRSLIRVIWESIWERPSTSVELLDAWPKVPKEEEDDD